MSLRSWSAAVALTALLLPAAARAQASGTDTPPPPPSSGSAPFAVEPQHGCPYAQGNHRCHGYALRWTTTGLAVTGIGTAIALEVLAVTTGNTLNQLYDARDPNHTLPAGSYADLAAMQSQRDAYQAASIGLFIGGGILTAAASFLWIAPHLHHRCCHHRPPPVAFDVGPGSASMTLRF